MAKRLLDVEVLATPQDGDNWPVQFRPGLGFGAMIRAVLIPHLSQFGLGKDDRNEAFRICAMFGAFGLHPGLHYELIRELAEMRGGGRDALFQVCAEVAGQIVDSGMDLGPRQIRIELEHAVKEARKGRALPIAS